MKVTLLRYIVHPMAELTGRFSWITDGEHLVIEGVLPVERLVRAAERTNRLTSCQLGHSRREAARTTELTGFYGAQRNKNPVQ